MTRPKVLLADDHSLLCEAFTKLLEPHCDVVGTVGNGRAVLDAVVMLNPDIVILDIGMPLLNGMDAARQLRQAAPKVKIIFLTMNEDPDLAAEAFRLGAAGYLLKNSAAKELVQAIEQVSQGHSYVTPLATKDLVESFVLKPGGAPKSGEMSSRQREVLQLLAEGHAMKSIARILKITPRTVAFHKYRLMDELNIKSNAELVHYAIKNHVVSF
jgi:DNA-binding NarL/FixJ family response regulator